MKVLSLFDGMACGMLAMLKAGIEVDRYVAYEYDEETANTQKGRPFGFAAFTSAYNFPTIEHKGDVFQGDFTEFSGFDFLVGGSPCTYWSIAQKNNRETEASGMGWELFSQYVRALHEAKPRFFIYENNKSMSNAIRASITETFGFEPIHINSALVSAQNRNRLYWVGKLNPDGTYSKVDVEQPEDRGIILADVLDSALAWQDKSYCLTSSYQFGVSPQDTISKSRRSMAVEPVAFSVLNINPSGKGINGAVGRIDTKCRCLTTNKGEGQKIIVPVSEPVCMRYERSEEAKAVRKQYEAGEIHHGFRELHELHPRTDGKTNTLSTVLKDNPICEPVCVAERGRYTPNGIEQRYEAREDGKTNTLTTVQKDNNVCEPVRVGTWPNTAKNQAHDSQQYRIYSTEGKGVTLCGNGGGMGAKTGLYAIPVEFEDDRPVKAMSGTDGKIYDVYEVRDGFITIKGKRYAIKLADGFYIIRKLTVSECKRLQTVPDWFEFPVSDSQAYKMLGNGWTVDVIVHLINATQAEQVADEQMDMWGDA